jgi:hypothetical protein
MLDVVEEHMNVMEHHHTCVERLRWEALLEQ